MDGRKDLAKQLEPPATFGASRPTGLKGLIPPSHFQSRSAPPLMGSATALPNWEAVELRRENQRLKDELHRWAATEDVASGGRVTDKTEDAGTRTRSLDREADPSSMRHTLAMSQQAEIISHQLHEIQRLEAELAALRVASARQEATAASRENTLAHLQGELADLRSQSQVESTALKAELEEIKGSRKRELETVKEELEQLRSQACLEADCLREELKSAKERHSCEIGLAQEALQRALEEAEAERKRQEERAQERLQAALREHQAEISRLSEAHRAEVSSLKHQAQVLQKDLEAQQKEAAQLQEERDVVRNQLRAAEAELTSQNALLMQLKTYVGEQESRQPSLEQEQLISRVQHLEEEKDALKTTVELLQVRLTSLSDILTLQEMELARKVHLKDPLQSESSQKLQCLLSRWREKVFSLLVQLKSQELCHMDTTKLLQRKVKELEEEVESKDQKVTVLLHSLEDKTAEADMERVRNKTLKMEVSHSKELAQKLHQRVEAGENALQGLVESVSRLHHQLMDQEETWKAALSRLLGLGNRISFATKRVDTVQGLVCQKIALAKLQREEKPGSAQSHQERRLHPPYEDLQAELQMLHEERDQLSVELKRGAQLIEKKVAEVREKAETDLKEMRETAQCLQGALEAKVAMEQALRQQQEATERQLEEAHTNLRETEEAAESLRQELGQLREEYEKTLQEKVTEVETQLHKDLSEMGKRLNEARREHTKAVVALHQAERQAARDKAHSEELAKLQETAAQQETGRLEARLQELERDKNLLMATLRQEGMLAQYRQNRLAAVQAPVELIKKGATQTPSKESLSAVLSDLQVLSAAILHEEEAEEKPDEDGGTESDT